MQHEKEEVREEKSQQPIVKKYYVKDEK